MNLSDVVFVVVLYNFGVQMTPFSVSERICAQFGVFESVNKSPRACYFVVPTVFYVLFVISLMLYPLSFVI